MFKQFTERIFLSSFPLTHMPDGSTQMRFLGGRRQAQLTTRSSLKTCTKGLLYQSIRVLTAAVAGWHRASLTHLTWDGMHANHRLIWTFKSNSDGLNGQLPQFPSYCKSKLVGWMPRSLTDFSATSTYIAYAASSSKLVRNQERFQLLLEHDCFCCLFLNIFSYKNTPEAWWKQEIDWCKVIP